MQAPTDPLSKKFAEAGKLALGDRPTLARNLGKLAARIDMAFPLKAARLMFKEADRETHWPKRKRLMRIPDEPSAVATGNGDYEAFSGQYLALAQAAGRMIAKSRGVGDPKHEVREAIRTLLIGTSFLPAYEPAGAGERSVVALLDELGSLIASRVGSETALTTLWSALENTPMGLRAVSSAEERADLDASALGVASIYPEDSHDSGYGVCFDTSFGEGASIEWAYPAVKVGTFVRDWRKRMFVLPPELAKAFDAPSVEDGSGLLNAWLSSRGWRRVEDAGLPNVEYDDNAEFGWQDVVLRSLYIAELRIAPDLDGRPRLQLEVRGLQDQGWHGVASHTTRTMRSSSSSSYRLWDH